MILTVLYKIIILSSLIIIPIYCFVQVIPEQAKVVYMNEKYFHNFTFYIKRYSRKSPYYMNTETTVKTEWNNNVTFNLVFYEFLHNQYRRSFVELHYKYCDFLNSEKFIASTITSYGIKCPLRPGHYYFMNMTFPLDNFPNVFPFERARAEIEYTGTTTGERILKLYFDASFRNKVVNK